MFLIMGHAQPSEIPEKFGQAMTLLGAKFNLPTSPDELLAMEIK